MPFRNTQITTQTVGRGETNRLPAICKYGVISFAAQPSHAIRFRIHWSYCTIISCSRVEPLKSRPFLEFHDFSSSLAPVEADARVFTASGAVLAPSNRAPKLSFADCFLASPATGASSPRRTRRLRPCGLSTFRMLAADRNAPLAETRIGLASGLRGDLRPSPERPSPCRTTKTLSVSPSVRV